MKKLLSLPKQIISLLRQKNRSSKHQQRVQNPVFVHDQKESSEPTVEEDRRNIVGNPTYVGEALRQDQILDSKLERVVVHHAAMLNSLPPNLPDNVVKLAAINEAFLQGILALRNMGLDDDLFLDAVQELRKKYDSAREPLVQKRQIESKEKSGGQDSLLNG